MPFQREEAQGIIRLRIQGALSIYEVVALRAEFMSCLDGDTGLELDLDGITECDTAGLQLLWAARKTAVARNKLFHIVGMPHTVLDTMENVGLNPKDLFKTAN